MSKEFILVVYDISHDRRRTRLHDALLDYGSPVQYSVFECYLEPQEAQKMRRAVNKVIRPRKDQVRFYHLCSRCLARTEVTSGAPVTGEEAGAIVV
ncbi:MAG: CRISPR-associated endonuclease Cas2 [Chloroflexia bacterium]|nr:CRISPR-associated endonuclease Cas2 [Chloroflexia bacterium]